MRVKICGVCRPEDAAVAGAAGADYVGVILSRSGPRYRDETAAARIFAATGTRRAGVFVDEPVGLVVGLAHRLSLDVVQLHGAEAADYASAVASAGAWEVWKALRLRDPGEAADGLMRYGEEVDAVLLDLARESTGAPGIWERIAGVLSDRPRAALWIAGGLRSDNVAAVVHAVMPDGVDVSSGVEDGPGRKSGAAVLAFISAARGGARASARPQS